MTINGVQGGVGNMSRGVVFVCLSRRARRHINTEACPGGRGVEQHRRLSRGVGQNRSLSRGHLRLSLGGRGIK